MKVIIAEDDLKTSNFIRHGLQENGYTVECFHDGRDALIYCLYNTCDLIIMDRLLPNIDGLSLLRALRATGKNTPIIFLTALTDVNDRVASLKAGGDAYLVKPFHLTELLARIAVLIRRPTPTSDHTLLNVHDLELDLLTHTVKRADTRIELHAKEFALLEILMRHTGRIVTKAMLLEQIWDVNFDPHTTVVETHISRLRAKIDKPFAVPLIHTCRNNGYSLYAVQCK